MIEDILEAAPELSDVLRDVITGLDHVEEESGIRDAYVQPMVYDLPPPEQVKTAEYERLFEGGEREYVHADRPPTPREVDAQLDREQLKTAQEEIAVMRAKHLENRPYITFDMDAQHAQLSVSVKRPALKKLMYELSGILYFGVDP